MGMKVRIEVAARMFGEAGEEKPAGRFMDDLALDAAAQFGMLFKMGQRDANRPFMRCDDPLVARHQRQDRDRLGGADVEVPAGMVLDTFLAAPTELLVADLAGQQFLELFGIDLARQAETGSKLATPFRRFVAALGIIVADRIVAADIGGRALETAGMYHAGFAFSRGPSDRPWLSSDTRRVPRRAPSSGMGVATTSSASAWSSIGKSPSPMSGSG